MREIKFRGKHKNPYGDKWVHGYYAMKDGNHAILMPHANDYVKSLNERKPIPPISVEHTIDVNTLGQYTGLKDKNGKEIYEGDIVQIYEKTKAEIKYGEYQESKCDEYDCTHYGYYLDYKHSNYCENTGIDLNDVSSMCEVIGNIYDNPELLEKYIREEN